MNREVYSDEFIPERCERCGEVQPNYRLTYGTFVCGLCIEQKEMESAQTVDDGGTPKAKVRKDYRCESGQHLWNPLNRCQRCGVKR